MAEIYLNNFVETYHLTNYVMSNSEIILSEVNL